MRIVTLYTASNQNQTRTTANLFKHLIGLTKVENEVMSQFFFKFLISTMINREKDPDCLIKSDPTCIPCPHISSMHALYRVSSYSIRKAANKNLVARRLRGGWGVKTGPLRKKNFFEARKKL